MDEQQKRVAAQNYVARLKGFYRNLIIYVIINAILAAFNLLHEPHNIWFYWVTIFWGIGVVIHAISVFGGQNQKVKNWEQKKVDEYMKKNGD